MTCWRACLLTEHTLPPLFELLAQPRACTVCGRPVWWVDNPRPHPMGPDVEQLPLCVRPPQQVDLDSCFARMFLAVN